MNEPEQLKRLDSNTLARLYACCDELRSEEINAMAKGEGGHLTKAGITRMRILLLELAKLSKGLRRELLAYKKGEKDERAF